MNLYCLEPQFVLSNPAPTSITMAAVTVMFNDASVSYPTQTFMIPAPERPTWYFITVDQRTQEATCQTSDALVGIEGHVYIGAIQASPASGSVNAIAGGWPPPMTFIVSKN